MSKPIALVALVAIAAGVAAEAAIDKDATFTVTDQALADKLVAEGQAKLADAAPAKAAKLVEVRLLVSNEHGQSGDWAEVPESVAKALKLNGEADLSAAAVAYAKAQRPSKAA